MRHGKAAENKMNLAKRLEAETTTGLDAFCPAILDCAFKGKL